MVYVRIGPMTRKETLHFAEIEIFSFPNVKETAHDFSLTFVNSILGLWPILPNRTLLYIQLGTPPKDRKPIPN